MTDAERRTALEAIADEVARCTACRLHAGRTMAVPGEGSPATEVVFVGEGPGEQEDRQGRPFVGASGQLLTELLESLGWRRPDVFITNVVKCRPPGNRDPQPDEIAACAPFLRRQLEALDPSVVVTVGKHSLNAFRPGERIGRVHGTATPADAATGAANALVFSMYHPAFALYQGSNRATLFEDMASLPGTLLAARSRREERAREGAWPAEAGLVASTGPDAPAAPGRATAVAAEPRTVEPAPVALLFPDVPGAPAPAPGLAGQAAAPSVSEPPGGQLTLF